MIEEVVDVTINVEEPSTGVPSFDRMVIVGTHKAFNERVKFYSSLAEAVTDGITVDSELYQAAQRAFSQPTRVSQIGIGRRTVNDVTLTVDTPDNDEVFTVTINGTDFSVTATVPTDDETDVALALVNAINGGSEPVTATDNADGSFDIEADVAGTPYTLSFTSNITPDAYVASDDIEDDLTAIREENSNWYGLALVDRTVGDVEDAAAWAEAQKNVIFGTASTDADIIGSGSADIASTIETAEYRKTFVVYNGTERYIEAGMLSNRLVPDPGSNNWAYFSVVGAVADNLTTTEMNNALGKNANIYQSIGGQNVVRLGTVGSGQYIDVVVGIDWLQAIIETSVFNLIYQKSQLNEKIPYTAQGISLVKNAVEEQLSFAVTTGFLDSYEVTAPAIEDVPSADKQARVLRNVNFTAVLANAVNKVIVNGTVSF